MKIPWLKLIMFVVCIGLLSADMYMTASQYSRLVVTAIIVLSLVGGIGVFLYDKTLDNHQEPDILWDEDYDTEDENDC